VFVSNPLWFCLFVFDAVEKPKRKKGRKKERKKEKRFALSSSFFFFFFFLACPSFSVPSLRETLFLDARSRSNPSQKKK
jgi:hypothetical protein